MAHASRLMALSFLLLRFLCSHPAGADRFQPQVLWASSAFLLSTLSQTARNDGAPDCALIDDDITCVNRLSHEFGVADLGSSAPGRRISPQLRGALSVPSSESGVCLSGPMGVPVACRWVKPVASCWAPSGTCLRLRVYGCFAHGDTAGTKRVLS
jgi:hypothetical protein